MAHERLRDEQQQEMEHAHGGGPGVPVMTSGQWKGFVFGVVVGGALGALLFAPFGLIPFGGISLPLRILVTAITGALAGGTAGALYYGGRAPEVLGETEEESGRPGVGSSPRDPHTDEVGHLRR